MKRCRDNVDLSIHSKERMGARNISEDDIDRVLRFGKRKHQGGKVLITYRGLKVVLSNDETTVVTSYRKGTK